MSAFEEKRLTPMLIGASGSAFDSSDYLFELKFDGVRCLAYADSSGIQLRNKRNLAVTDIYPELQGLGDLVQGRCILDGELVAFRDGKPSFSEIQRRSLMGDPFRIHLAAAKLPVCFVAFDILYWKNKETMLLPLSERKELLQKAVREDSSLLISRVIEGKGIPLYAMAEAQPVRGRGSQAKVQPVLSGQKDERLDQNKTSVGG